MAGERWIFTKSQLLSTPSRKAGLDSDKELSYRQQAANLIQDMGQRLQVQLCINTAIVYMHRFYMFHSFQRFHRNSISPACLFLAAKVEEQSRKLEHVIKVAHLCLHREAAALDTKSDDYLEKAHDLVINENILLQTLGFDITVDHPHTHVVKTSQLVRASKDLAQTSYFLATNSLHLTTMCLQYRPTVVACVCIHLACKWSNWEIPTSSEGKDWFWYVDKNVKLELLEDLTQDFLNILDRCPSRLKRKIMTWKSTREKDDDKDGPSEKRARMLEASASSTADTPGSSSPGSQNIASFVRTKAEFLLQTSGQKSGERSPVSFSSFKLHEQLTGGHGSKKPTSHKADSHGHSLGSTVHSLEKKSQFKTGSHSMIRTDPDKKPEKGTHTIHKYNSPLKLTITKEPSVDSRDLQTKDGRKSSIALSQSKQGSSHEINTQASQEYMRQKLFSPVKSSKLDITKLTGQSSSFQQHHGTNVKPAKHSIHGNSHHSQASTSSKASFSNPTNVFSSLEHTELVAQPTKHKQPASPVVNELMSPQKNLAKMPRMIELATGQHFSADVINQIASTVDFSTDVGQELQNPFLLESELALKSLEANGSGTSPQVPSGSTAGREKFDQLQLQLQQLIDLQKSHIAHLQQQQQELTQQHDIFLSDSSLPPFPPIPQELPPLPPMPPSSPPPQPKF